jgi:hypothetical protein
MLPGANANPNPNFSARPKTHFRRRSLICRDLRRARELLAQIVLFGVELGVGIVGASVSESVRRSVSEIGVGPVVGRCACRGASKKARHAASFRP